MSGYRRDETGAIGGLEGLAFGVLLFAFGTLLVVNAWAVVNAKLAAGAAAREAVRAYVEAPDDTSGRADATSAAGDALAGHGSPPANVSVDTAQALGQYRRCQPVRASVTVVVPRVSLPLIGGTGGTFAVVSDHVEIVDPYRSGLDGQAVC